MRSYYRPECSMTSICINSYTAGPDADWFTSSTKLVHKHSQFWEPQAFAATIYNHITELEKDNYYAWLTSESYGCWLFKGTHDVPNSLATSIMYMNTDHLKPIDNNKRCWTFSNAQKHDCVVFLQKVITLFQLHGLLSMPVKCSDVFETRRVYWCSMCRASMKMEAVELSC